MAEKIAVMGAGAVGCFFGAMLSRAGSDVVVIGRGARLDALRRSGLFFDSFRGQKRIHLRVSGDPAAAADADYVLLTVKTTDTETAARALAPHLGSQALLVSLQNGVDNAARIKNATGLDAASAAVYVAVQMPEPGHLQHSARGDVILGGIACERLKRLAEIFTNAGIPAQIESDIRPALWAKMFNNCAYNAISALTGSQYGPMLKSSRVRALMRQAVEEAAAVAQAEGVQIHGDPVEAAYALGRSMPKALSSTAQDLQRARPTEIASLNGYIARRAAELGLSALINDTLATLVAIHESEGPSRIADTAAKRRGRSAEATAQAAQMAYEVGEILWSVGDLRSAFRQFISAARGGCTPAYRLVGQFYQQGDGVRANTDEALRWYRRAARAGSDTAANNSGCIWRERGKNRRAIGWFQCAVKLGLGDAHFEIARIHISKGQFIEARKSLRKTIKSRTAIESTKEEARQLLASLAIQKRGKNV